VAMFPPALSLATVRDARADRSDVLLGVQNIHSQLKGAFTGENSAPMAHDAGATLSLVGHSERRHIFGETNLETARKVAIAQQCSLTPVLCVGETLEQKRFFEQALAGQTDLLGRRPDHVGPRVGHVLPTRWIE